MSKLLPGTKSADEKTESVLVENATDLNEQVPTFVDLLPEQVQPYWQFVQQYPIAHSGSRHYFCTILGLGVPYSSLRH